MTPEQQAVRENNPPPGYSIFNANGSGAPTGHSGPTCDVYVFDAWNFADPSGKRHFGGFKDRRETCLAAWDHFDAESKS